jgi:hypothetical protein
MRWLASAIILLFAAACTRTHKVHGCSPLSSDECLLPFPNAWFEQADTTTASHERVLFPDGDLPAMSNGVPLQADLFGRIDGFSPATTLVAYFKNGVDGSQLAPSGSTTVDDRIPLSLTDDCPIVLLDLAARARVPFFAELDANANPMAGDRQALLIHPMVRLKFATRYAVAIRTTLHDASGQPLAPEGQFADWVHGKLSKSAALSEIADRLDADATAFAAIGIQKSDLALAWDFDTASADSTTGQLTLMRDQALKKGPQGFGFTVTSTQEPASGDTYRLIQGTFQAPSFETGPDPSPLAIDSDGHAIMGALADWPFTALIPTCATTAKSKLPILILGHGIFDSAATTVPGNDWLAQGLCMVLLGTDWKGVSASDLGILTNVLADVNDFPLVTSRLEQAHLNFQVLARLALNGLAQSPALVVNGQSIVDTMQLYYRGISNGGIQGGTFLALSTDANRGVLDLVGDEWSLLMWRSNDFAAMLIALQFLYPDRIDLQVVMALTQSLWDKTDPIEFTTSLAGASKQVLFRESVHDPVVTNIATRTMMRTIGAQALGPMVEPAWNLPGMNGPLTGLVYSQWSINPQPLPPLENVPPANNGGHYDIAGSPGAVTQMQSWLKPGGVAINPCGGPCSF